MPRVSQVLPWMVAATLSFAALPAQAQSNLDAGKSAAQIFSATCNACHRSPRELKQSSAGFLREHYTTGPREAAAMAAYLASVGSDPRAVQQRRPPTLGAGQAASPTESGARGAEQGKPTETQAALPATPGRRPPGATDSGPIGRDEATPPIRQRGNGQASGRRRGQRRGGCTSADRDCRPRAVTCRRRVRGVAPDLPAPRESNFGLAAVRRPETSPS